MGDLLVRRNSRKRRAVYSLYRKWSKDCLATKKHCPVCNGKLLYYCKYDSDICPYCNTWQDNSCNDPNCCFCANRLTTPEEALQSDSPPFSENEIARNFKTRKRLRDPFREKQLNKSRNILEFIFSNKSELNARKALIRLINRRKPETSNKEKAKRQL